MRGQPLRYCFLKQRRNSNLLWTGRRNQPRAAQTAQPQIQGRQTTMTSSKLMLPEIGRRSVIRGAAALGGLQFLPSCAPNEVREAVTTTRAATPLAKFIPAYVPCPGPSIDLGHFKNMLAKSLDLKSAAWAGGASISISSSVPPFAAPPYTTCSIDSIYWSYVYSVDLSAAYTTLNQLTDPSIGNSTAITTKPIGKGTNWCCSVYISNFASWSSQDGVRLSATIYDNYFPGPEKIAGPYSIDAKGSSLTLAASGATYYGDYVQSALWHRLWLNIAVPTTISIPSIGYNGPPRTPMIFFQLEPIGGNISDLRVWMPQIERRTNLSDAVGTNLWPTLGT